MKNGIAASIVVTALIIGAGIGYLGGLRGTTTTTPVTTSNSSSRLYELIFNQTSPCSSQSTYYAPWGVILDNATTITEPNLESPPGSFFYGWSPAFKNYSVIIFSVPNGRYSYAEWPNNVFTQKGTVVVNGVDTVVHVEPGVTAGCTTTTTAASASHTTTTMVDTFFTSSCVITGIGGFEFRVVSDSTGLPVSGENISAIDRLGCNVDTQVVYINHFNTTQGGWLTPVFPSQALPGGGLDFTVVYEGQTYTFTTGVPPIGSACVTLYVPSGNVTTTTVMNGSGSYC
jgi:hypothetical protein